MDADSVSHMMHCEHLITDDDYEAITAAPNDNKMNTLLLQYVRSMNMNQLSKFCDIFKSIETHKINGDCSLICKCINLLPYYHIAMCIASYCIFFTPGPI